MAETPESRTGNSLGRLGAFVRRRLSPQSSREGSPVGTTSVDGQIASRLSPHLSRGNVEKVADFFIKNSASIARNPISRTLKTRELNSILREGGTDKRMDLKATVETAKLFQERQAELPQRGGSPVSPSASKESLVEKMEGRRAAFALEKGRDNAPARPEPVLPNVQESGQVTPNAIFRPAGLRLQSALASTQSASRSAKLGTDANGESLGSIHPQAIQRSSSNVSELSNNDFSDAKPLIGTVDSKLGKALAARAEQDRPTTATRLTGRGGEDLGTPDPHFIRRSSMSSTSSFGSQFSDTSTRSGSSNEQRYRGAAGTQPSTRGLTAKALETHNRTQEAQRSVANTTMAALPERSRERLRTAGRD
jgi:hypothetical protein